MSQPTTSTRVFLGSAVAFNRQKPHTAWPIMNRFIIGQRWISESEPELGLGTVVQAEAGRVQLTFPASGETRMYASDNAPLRRVRFRIGDRVTTNENTEITVQDVIERE